MASVRTLKTSFVGGEIAPEMFGRVDFAQYQSGLAWCENFMVAPQGAVFNRAGFAYCVTAKLAGASKVRLLPFSFNSTQTMAIELGAGYFRFLAEGGAVSYPAVGAELLLNPAFQSHVGSVLTDWVAYCSGGGTATWDSGNGGQLSLSAVSGGMKAGVYQIIATVPGQVYGIEIATTHLGFGGSVQVFAESALAAANLVSGFVSSSGYAGLSFTAVSATTCIRVMSASSFGSSLAGVSTRLTGTGIVAFSSAASYALGQLVFFSDGLVYKCIAASTGNLPTNVSFWQASPVGVYELANSYLEADLFDIHFVQSGDVVTLVHPAYPPMELKRYGNISWTFAAISFASSLAAPSAPTAVATNASGSTYLVDRKYLLTALDEYGLEESLASASSAVCSNDLTVSGNFNTVTWTGAGGSAIGYYNVYCSLNGSYGFVGQVVNASGTLTFVDRNITPDVSITPPLNDAPLASVGNYPGAVGYYEQRRVFAGSNNKPMNFWATQPATASNMNYSVPSQASDALRIGIQAARSSAILHVVGGQDLLLLTASDEWRVFTASGDALTPSTVTIKKQQNNGATKVTPVLTQNRLIYAAGAGGHLRSMVYDWQVNGYRSDDLCLLAQHLFRNHSIVDMAYSRWSPNPTLWAVRDDGVLLGLTYEPSQEVVAWHRHSTVNGLFESVCCIQEGNTDVLYAVVKRVINGSATRYIERLDSRGFGSDLSSAFFVDSGISQTFSTAVSSVSGLTWLAGQTVSALLDGKAVSGLTVSGAGAVTLPFAATKVVIGLPITSTFKTLPATVAGDASFGLGHVKNVNKVWARVVDFCGCKAGAVGGTLVSIPALAKDGAGHPVMADGELRSVPMPLLNNEGGIQFVQDLPLPLMVCDVVLEVSVGG